MAESHQFSASAVENTIFNLLAASEKNYDFPPLQKEAVAAISINLTNIIYDTLKKKSIASSTKRCNLLKFLNNFCESEECHLGNNSYKFYLDAYKKQVCTHRNYDVENFIPENTQELTNLVLDLNRNVLEFYKRKNLKRREKVKKLEFIKQNDQEQLNLTLGMQVLRNCSYYETSETLIHDLLGLDSSLDIINKNKPVLSNQDTKEYREKQIKFCYGVLNIGDCGDLKLLETTLKKILNYKNLENFEISFLMDLWLLEDKYSMDISDITGSFSFIIEKIIIKFCSEIVRLQEETDVCQYFLNLGTNSKIIKLQSVCRCNLGFYCRMKSLIYELYIFSYCNSNVLRLCDFII